LIEAPSEPGSTGSYPHLTAWNIPCTGCAGSDGVSGLKTEDFHISSLFGNPFLRREMLCAIPPTLSLEKIFCLAWITSDSGDSGRIRGFDGRAKGREI